MDTKTVVLLGPEVARRDQLLQGIPLHVLEELLRHLLGHHSLLSLQLDHLAHLHLSEPSVLFIEASQAVSLLPLGLDEHGLSSLLVFCSHLLKNFSLMLLDHLDSSMLEGLANQYLEDGLHLELIVKQIRVLPLIQESRFVMARVVGHEHSWVRLVDVVVWLDQLLIHHIVVVSQLDPFRLDWPCHRLEGGVGSLGPLSRADLDAILVDEVLAILHHLLLLVVLVLDHLAWVNALVALGGRLTVHGCSEACGSLACLGHWFDLVPYPRSSLLLLGPDLRMVGLHIYKFGGNLLVRLEWGWTVFYLLTGTTSAA